MQRPASEGDGGEVIITSELDRRPSRAPDYAGENRALTGLAEAMSMNPDTVLQQLVEVAMALTRSEFAGIGLLEPGGDTGAFRWVASTGAWSSYRDGTIPADASLCGEGCARDTVLLIKNPERAFPALHQPDPCTREGLVAPICLGGAPVGTLWVVKRDTDEQFEPEDARILRCLASFASAAQQTLKALQTAKVASQQAEVRMQQLVALAEISTEFFGICDMEFLPIYGNAAAMQMVGLVDLEQVRRTPVLEFFFPEDRAFIAEAFFPKVLRDGHGKIETRFRHFVTGDAVWVDYSLVVLTDEAGRATGLGTVTHDITERKRTEAALRDSEARERAIFAASPTPFLVMEPDTPRFTISQVNDAYLAATVTTRADLVGRGVFDMFPDNVPDPTGQGMVCVRASLEQVLATRSADHLPVLQFDVQSADGSVEERWWRLINSPVLNERGEVEAIIHFATDITERKRAEEHADVLMAEVNHRARNLLAVVQAVAQQTAKSGDPQTFVARLSDRINGLAANQDLLVKNLWRGVDVAELAKAQLVHFADLIGKRIRMEGAELTLTAAASQAIGMALHELATNAAKYGALSNGAGAVRIDWQASAGPDRVFSMSWVETGGPPVTMPTRAGFGRTVIKRLVEVAVGGTVEIGFAATGVTWQLQTPARNVLVSSGEAMNMGSDVR